MARTRNRRIKNGEGELRTLKPFRQSNPSKVSLLFLSSSSFTPFTLQPSSFNSRRSRSRLHDFRFIIHQEKTSAFNGLYYNKIPKPNYIPKSQIERQRRRIKRARIHCMRKNNGDTVLRVGFADIIASFTSRSKAVLEFTNRSPSRSHYFIGSGIPMSSEIQCHVPHRMGCLFEKGIVLLKKLSTSALALSRYLTGF